MTLKGIDKCNMEDGQDDDTSKGNIKSVKSKNENKMKKKSVQPVQTAAGTNGREKSPDKENGKQNGCPNKSQNNSRNNGRNHNNGRNNGKHSGKNNGKNNGKRNGKQNGKNNLKNIRWIIIIWVSSFFLSGFFSIVSSGILSQVNVLVAVIVLVTIIFINIIFDIIGTASTAADPVPFHSMASRKVKGAREAIKLIKHADRVSNFCNDVVGDICGILSGAATAYIVLKMAERGFFTGSVIHSVVEIILSGLVASLTVGGKSIGKTLAIKNSNDIIYRVALFIRLFKRR